MDLTNDYPQFQQREALGMQEWPPLPQILFAHILKGDDAQELKLCLWVSLSKLSSEFTHLSAS